MENWEKTVKRFCDLGGIIENVMLNEGSFGRGVFPKNNKLPIKMTVPHHLLCSTDWLQIDEKSNLILSSDCDWNAEIKSFYLDYQRDYGIGGSLMSELMQQQTELFVLPESVKAMLISYGIDQAIFQKATIQSCLDVYKRSRRISVNDKQVLMPLIELVNHDEGAKKSFDTAASVSISGTFKDEVLINYDILGDAIGMFEGYGFSVVKPYTFSGTLGINLGTKAIKIARFFTLYNKIENTVLPRLNVIEDDINLSFLVLGSVNDKNSPKKIFIKLMHSVGMPTDIASNVFDDLVEQNKSFFLHLLEELKPLDGTVVQGLRTMAKNQLIPLGVHI